MTEVNFIGLVLYKPSEYGDDQYQYLLTSNQPLKSQQREYSILRTLPASDGDHLEALTSQLKQQLEKAQLNLNEAIADFIDEFQFKLTVDKTVTLYYVARYRDCFNYLPDNSLCKWFRADQAYKVLSQNEQELLRTIHSHVIGQKNEGQSDNEASTVTVSDHKLYKTKLCRTFQVENQCRYGSKCHFAHGPEELRTINLTKFRSSLSTSIVATHQFSVQAAPDITSQPNLATTLKQQPPQLSSYKDQKCSMMKGRYKTRLCDKWLVNGSCPYHSKCTFAHGEQELRTEDCYYTSNDESYTMQVSPNSVELEGASLNSASHSVQRSIPDMAQFALNTSPEINESKSDALLESQSDHGYVQEEGSSPKSSHSAPQTLTEENVISLAPITINKRSIETPMQRLMSSHSSFTSSLFENLWSTTSQLKSKIEPPPGVSKFKIENSIPFIYGQMDKQQSNTNNEVPRQIFSASVQSLSLQSVIESLIISKQDNIPIIVSIIESVSKSLSREERHSVLVSSILKASYEDCVTLSHIGSDFGQDCIVLSPVQYVINAKYIIRAMVCGSLISQFAFLVALDNFVENNWFYAPYVQRFAPDVLNYILSGDDFPAFNIEIVLIWYAQFKHHQLEHSRLRPALLKLIEVRMLQVIGF